MQNLLNLVAFLCIYKSWVIAALEDNGDADVNDFMEDIVDWIRDKNQHMKTKNVIKEEDCIIIHFGYTKELPYHQLSFSSPNFISVNLGTYGMNTANTCWIALVAGSHLQHMESILETIDSLSEQMQKTAYAVFLLGDVENITRHHWTPPIVKIGLHNGRSPNIVFDFTCEGDFIVKSSKLLLRNGVINKPISEVCPETFIKIAYNEEMWTYEVDPKDPSKLTEYEDAPGTAWHWEMLHLFFSNYNLTARFFDNNGTWGWYDEETMSWNGVIEMVQNGTTDMGLGFLGCSPERSTVIQCSHMVGFFYEHWITKKPGPLPPRGNLIQVFTPLVWGLILLSATLFSAYLLFAAKVGTYIGTTNRSYEDFVVPFRLPVPIHVPAVSKNLFPRGFSANFILIIWGVFAAVFAYAFLAIFRDILIMPVYEDPIDSYQDVIDKGLIPFAHEGSHYYREHLENSPNPGYKYLASIYEIPETSAEYVDWLDNDIGVHGIKAYIGILSDWEIATGLYHTSEEHIFGLNPSAGYVFNKKMRYSEEMQRTLLYFTQAGLMIDFPTYTRFPAKPLVKIQLDHLFIAYVILGAGTLLATIAFIFELCLGSCRKKNGVTKTQENEEDSGAQPIGKITIEEIE